MTATTSSRFPLWLALVGAIAVGALTAGQARINGQLGVHLDNGLLAAAISFASGLVLVTAISAMTAEGRRGFRNLTTGLRSGNVQWWMVLGGAAGALTVATQGLTVAIIGVSLFTVGVVAGQALAGLVIDRSGFGPAGVVVVTLPRVLGALLALTAIAVSMTGDVLARTPWWMLAMPFVAGVGIAWQQATNGRLRAIVGTPLTATLVNFIGGTAILGVAAVISVSSNGVPAAFPTEPWMYLGGAMGVTYIFMATAIVSRTGVLLLGLASVVGQVATSALIDIAWPTAGGVDAWHQSVMVALALASVVVAAVPWHRMRRRATER